MDGGSAENAGAIFCPADIELTQQYQLYSLPLFLIDWVYSGQLLLFTLEKSHFAPISRLDASDRHSRLRGSDILI